MLLVIKYSNILIKISMCFHTNSKLFLIYNAFFIKQSNIKKFPFSVSGKLEKFSHKFLTKSTNLIQFKKEMKKKPILHYHLEPKHTSLRNKVEISPFHLLTPLKVPRLSLTCKLLGVPLLHPPNSDPQLSTVFYLLCTRGETHSQPAKFSPGVLKDCYKYSIVILNNIIPPPKELFNAVLLKPRNL